ncbi:WD40 repeat domain-containing serine/threonine protein kinase [Aporhodopirellula aestuarii]|uniref:Protein kinase n=1 Tax=Aporhodopirellula aestuarii TaxID=2950107 RepID=A0ABT0U724_9BACT|nr:protein kinase [Aporhodopirellula aestuarii]MCM2372762.1 protein kinase [Aporhodopirellula aestuarii]
MTNESAADDEAIQVLLAELLEAAERGEAIDREQLCSLYPQYADSICEFLDNNGLVRDAMAVFRDDATERPIDSAFAPTLDSQAAGQSTKFEIGDSLRYVGEYEIVDEIARGGMGIVFRARQSQLRRDVALKMILAGRLASDADVDRFYREARAAAALKHPNIVSVHEVGEHEGHHYFTMDLVDGRSLASSISEETLSPKKAAELIKTVTLAIAYAHHQGVLHRDLKPANILIDESGQPHVTDFGLAKTLSRDATDNDLTATGQILGTPSYMAPEQALAKHQLVGVACDVYSLGAILYACLSGRGPFVADSAVDTIRQVIEKEPVSLRLLNPQVPKDLETICLKCLQKEPQSRYGTAGELACDLDRFLEGRPVSARPISRISKTMRWCRRNRVVVAAAVALITSLCLGIIGTTIGLARAMTSEQKAISDRNKATELAADNRALAIRERDAKRELQELSEQLAKQLKQETVWRLAAQSEATRMEMPVLSLLLAIEAVETTWRDDHSVLPVAHQTIVDALSQVKGVPLVGHSEPVYSIDIAPGGRWMYTTSKDGAIRRWDLSREEIEATPTVIRGHGVLGVAPTVHGRWVSGTRATADGRWLVSIGHDKTTRLWDLKSQNPATSHRILEHRTGTVSQVAISPDGRWLATAGYIDPTISLWDLSAGADVRKVTLNGHSSFVTGLEFTPDGKRLISASQATARIWNYQDPEDSESIPLRGHTSTILTLAISENSQRLVTAGADRTIRVWDLAAENPGAKPVILTGHEATVRDLDLTPDGRTLVSASEDRTARVWDLDAESHLRLTLKGHRNWVKRVKITSDGRYVITGSEDKTLRLWDLNATDPMFRELKGHESPIRGIVLDEDHSRFVTISDDLAAREWSLQSFTREGIVRVVDERAWVNSVSITNDMEWLVTTGTFLPDSRSNGSRSWTKVIRLKTNESAFYTSGTARPKISKQLSQAFATDADGSVRVLKLDSRSLGRTDTFLKLPEWHAARIAINTKGTRLAVVYRQSSRVKRKAVLWDVSTAPPEIYFERPAASDCCVISSDEKLATVGDDWNINITNLANPHQPASVLNGHNEPLTAMEWGPEGRWLVSGGQDKIIKIWDALADDPSSTVISLRGHNNTIKHLAISPDGRWLVSTDNDDVTVRLWNLAAWDRGPSYVTLSGHRGTISNVSFSPDSKMLVTGSSDHTARVWYLDESPSNAIAKSIVLKGHDDDVSDACFTSDGAQVVTSSRDGTVRFWKVNPKAVLEDARRRAGRRLTEKERSRFLSQPIRHLGS